MFKISKVYFNIKLKDCTFLGRGYEGRAYLTPEGQLLKVFYRKINCRDEYNILKEVEESKFFPKVYKCKSNYMLREYIDGVDLIEYIKKNGLSRKLALGLIQLIEEFEKFNFLKLDIRCQHIFVLQDENIKIIDPRSVYSKKVDKPYHILKELKKAKVMDEFMKVLVEYKIEYAKRWLGNQYF